jgi:hypothetical protein
MNLRRLLKFAIAVLVTVGLASAPLAEPAATARTLPAGMSDMSMSADMPCCPDEQKSKDCQDCPLIAICTLQAAQQEGPSMVAAMPLRHAVRTTHLLANDVLGDGLDRPPPEQPPRSLA